MNFSAFKAYDIRGKYPDEVNEDLAYQIGRAVVKFFKAKTIVVGRDMRNSSPQLLSSLIRGITYGGADVINIGEVTTPMLNFAVVTYNCDGGVMVTASHNPGSDNAFKIINRQVEQLYDTYGLDKLKRIIKHGFKPSEKSGVVITRDIFDEYLAHLKRQIGELPSLRLAIDYGNGVGSISASRAFASFNIWCQELYPEPDGNFPNHPANPHDLVNYDDLIKIVLGFKTDFGVFFDGDADRANFVDDLGRIVPIDLLIILLAREELKRYGSGKVLYDLRFSKTVASNVANANGTPVMMRVGNPYYKQSLRTNGGILGAEFSGHVMFKDNYYIDDGLFLALKVVKLIGSNNQKLSTMLDSVREAFDSPEISLVANDPSKVYKRVLSGFRGAKKIKMDGVYLDFADGFISVRQSQGEPKVFRFRVEASTLDKMQERVKIVQKAITGLDGTNESVNAD